jgi:hypothetical protein
MHMQFKEHKGGAKSVAVYASIRGAASLFGAKPMSNYCHGWAGFIAREEKMTTKTIKKQANLLSIT